MSLAAGSMDTALCFFKAYQQASGQRHLPGHVAPNSPSSWKVHRCLNMGDSQNSYQFMATHDDYLIDLWVPNFLDKPIHRTIYMFVEIYSPEEE